MNARTLRTRADVLADLVVAGEVGAGDRSWPRTAGGPARRLPELSPLDVARRVLEDAREQLDELLFVRFGPDGEPVDLALGVVGGWSPPRKGRCGWRLVATTAELLEGWPNAAGVAPRVRAVLREPAAVA